MVDKSEYERGREAGLAEAAVLLEREMNYWRRELDPRTAMSNPDGEFRGGVRGMLSRLRHLQNLVIETSTKALPVPEVAFEWPVGA